MYVDVLPVEQGAAGMGWDICSTIKRRQRCVQNEALEIPVSSFDEEEMWIGHVPRPGFRKRTSAYSLQRESCHAWRERSRQ